MAEPQAPTKVAIVAISRTGLELSWNGTGDGEMVRTVACYYDRVVTKLR